MVSQEELLQTILNNGGVVSTTELRKLYNIKKGNGLGHISQRLNQLMKKGIIAKVKGLNGEVIYFLIDLSCFESRTCKKYSLSSEDLREIEQMIKKGYSLKDISKIKGISYRWVKELHKRYRTHGYIFLKKDGRPLRGTT